MAGMLKVKRNCIKGESKSVCVGMTSSLCACVVLYMRINLNFYLILNFELINDVKCNFLKYQDKTKKQLKYRRLGVIFF